MHNTPEGHVTRDCKEGAARLGDLAFRCVDTSGLEPFMAAATLQARATRLTMRMLHGADLALLLLDGRCGPPPPPAPPQDSSSDPLSRHRKLLIHCNSGPGRNWVSWPTALHVRTVQAIRSHARLGLEPARPSVRLGMADVLIVVVQHGHRHGRRSTGTLDASQCEDAHRGGGQQVRSARPKQRLG